MALCLSKIERHVSYKGFKALPPSAPSCILILLLLTSLLPMVQLHQTPLKHIGMGFRSHYSFCVQHSPFIATWLHLLLVFAQCYHPSDTHFKYTLLSN